MGSISEMCSASYQTCREVCCTKTAASNALIVAGVVALIAALLFARGYFHLSEKATQWSSVVLCCSGVALLVIAMLMRPWRYDG